MCENNPDKSQQKRGQTTQQISFDKYLQKKLTKKQIDILYPPDYPNQHVVDTQYTLASHIDQNQIYLRPNQSIKVSTQSRQSTDKLGQKTYWTMRKRVFCGFIILFICIAIALVILLPLVLVPQIDETRQFCSWFSTKLIKVKLYWNDTNADLDLFVKQPWGDYVYYDHRSGHFGQLQRDVRNGPGPEVYSAECTSMGVYQISTQYYDPRGAVTCQIQIFAGDQNRTIYNEIVDENKKIIAKIFVDQLYGIGDFKYSITDN